MRVAIISFVIIGAVKILLAEEYIPEDDIIAEESQICEDIHTGIADINREVEKEARI